MGQVIPNRGLQFANATEGPSPNPAVCEQAKKAFHLIQPTRAGWCDVQVITRATGKPALNFGHLVRAVIVHHQMNIEVLRDGFIDPLQEPQEFLMPLAVMQRNQLLYQWLCPMLQIAT